MLRVPPGHLTLFLALSLLGCRVELGAPGAAACESSAPTGEVLIYTSMYRPVVEALEAAAAQDLPAIKPRWYQAGSEKVAARLDAELAAGACPADLLLTSDPAHYARLKSTGALLPHASVGAFRVPRELVDPDGAFVAVRVSTMVLTHLATLPAPPTSMADLWSPRFKGEAVLGDPLSSGTFFSLLGILELVHGPGFFAQLRGAGVVATGGNSTVQEKVLNGEKKAGLILLENVLAARKVGQPLQYALPADGVVLVPGPMALLSTAPHAPAARAVMDWLLGERAQRIIVDVGMMHATREGIPPPGDAPPLSDLLKVAIKLEGATWDVLSRDGAAMKARFGAAYGR